MGGEDGCEWRLEAIIRTRLYNSYFYWSRKFKILYCGNHVKAVTARTFKLRISTWATIFPVIYKCVKRKMKK